MKIFDYLHIVSYIFIIALKFQFYVTIESHKNHMVFFFYHIY